MRDASRSEQVSLGPVRQIGGSALVALYVIAGLWAAMNVAFFIAGFFFLQPNKALIAGLAGFVPWLPFVAVVAFVRWKARTPRVIRFDDDGFTVEYGLDASRFRWDTIESVALSREQVDGLEAEPFPRILVVRERPTQGATLGRSLSIQPGLVPTLEAVCVLLSRCVDSAPPCAVDLEAVLLLALLRRMEVAADALDHGVVGLAPNLPSTTVRSQLTTTKQEDPAINAMFRYFSGDTDTAIALMAGEPHDTWDLRLCQALCARERCDQGAYRASLRTSMNSANAHEARIIEHALNAVGGRTAGS